MGVRFDAEVIAKIVKATTERGKSLEPRDRTLLAHQLTLWTLHVATPSASERDAHRERAENVARGARMILRALKARSPKATESGIDAADHMQAEWEAQQNSDTRISDQYNAAIAADPDITLDVDAAPKSVVLSTPDPRLYHGLWWRQGAGVPTLGVLLDHITDLERATRTYLGENPLEADAKPRTFAVHLLCSIFRDAFGKDPGSGESGPFERFASAIHQHAGAPIPDTVGKDAISSGVTKWKKDGRPPIPWPEMPGL